MTQTPVQRALAATHAVRAALAFAWKKDAIFLALLTAMNLFFARRTFGAGIWADNDSVSHYAYLRYFVEEFHPKTGALLGWCPKFNLGLPYLLFNTPPLLYATAGYASIATGMSPLAALKLVMTAAFLSVPLLAYALARTFERPAPVTGPQYEPGDLAKFVALTTSLFSSELFGLEFFFKNGMLNPAFGVPFLMASLVCYRHAITKTMPRALAWVAATGACFALTMLTHTLSAYMLCVAMVGFAFGAPVRAWGANVIKAGGGIAVGVLLSAFWLVPSLPFGAKQDAAYTWIREPAWTVGHLLDGSLLASYPVGFFPTFITVSHVGFVANVVLVYGAWAAIRRRAHAFAGCAIALLLALWISVGPRYSAIIAAAPMYDRLLWFRFITLVSMMAMIMAGYGAWRFAQRDFRWYPLNLVLLACGGTWAFFVMTERAVKVKTASSYPEFQASVDAIASWLREKGDKRGRLYSEFLGQGVVEAISVNYTREMLPVLTGFEEVSGWIYENNPASQVLMKRGPYWYDPLPILELAPTYDVKYIVAGTPNLVKALSEDPRWRSVVRTPELVLFEAAREPSRVEARGWDARLEREEYVQGGGYRYAIALARRDVGGARTGGVLVVKTNGSPGWRATTAGGRSLDVTANDDGLLAVALPPDLPDGDRVEVVWDVSDSRRKGNLVTLVGVAVALGLLAASRARGLARLSSPAASRWARLAGLGGAGLAVVALGVRARKVDLSRVGFGVAGGIVPVFDPSVARVGRYDDDRAQRPNRVVAAAWGERALCGDEPCRLLKGDAPIAGYVTLAPSGPNGLTIAGALDAPGGGAIGVTLLAGAREACSVHATLGVEIALPDACARGDDDGRAPGVLRAVRLSASAPLRVTSLAVKSGIAWIEAESFRNVVDDGGSDAFYSLEAPEYAPSNGIAMAGGASWGAPIDLKRDVDLAPGEYQAWALVRVYPERFLATRADIALGVNGREVAVLDPRPRTDVPFWESLARFEWAPMGRLRAERSNALTLEMRWREHAIAALADLDAIALVPIGSSAPSP